MQEAVAVLVLTLEVVVPVYRQPLVRRVTLHLEVLHKETLAVMAELPVKLLPAVAVTPRLVLML